MTGMNSAVPPPKPAAMMPAARPRRSRNHLSADPIEPLYTSAAPIPATMYAAYNCVSVWAYPIDAHPTPHNTPAAVMNGRGPSQSMSQPSSGCTHVWNRMNSVKASEISDSFQPVAVCIGTTNSVHEYCRLAIMIIATSDAPSCTQRLFNFTARLLDVVTRVDPFLSIRSCRAT